MMETGTSSDVHDKNCPMQLLRSSNTCTYNQLTTKQCKFQLGLCCTSVSCSACICSSSCLITALSGTALYVSAACALVRTTCKTFWKPTIMRCHSCSRCHSFPSAHTRTNCGQMERNNTYNSLLCCSVLILQFH